MAASLFGIGDGDEDLAAIRALRSQPPGMAGDGKRGKTFDACLEQFEQLLRAGRQLPADSAPILLFYALAQGGRAVLAAHGPQPWQVHGHGLSVGIEGSEIGAATIAPSGEGLFQAVAAVTGSPLPDEPMTLAETWASIPQLSRPADLGPLVPAIFVVTNGPDSRLRLLTSEDGGLVPWAEEIASKLETSLGSAHAEVRQLGTFPAVGLEFDSGADATAFEVSLWSYLGQGYLRVPESGAVPSGLMLWWMLLQALSQFARYEPARWRAALAPDRSTLAVPLEETLHRAAVLLPRLLREALAPAG